MCFEICSRSCSCVMTEPEVVGDALAVSWVGGFGNVYETDAEATLGTLK